MNIIKNNLLTLLLFVATAIHAQTTLLEQNFKQSQGDFTIEDTTLPTGMTHVWTQNSSYGMVGTGYVSGSNHDCEGWLISPAISLVGYQSAKVTINHSINKYFYSLANDATLWVKAEGGDWQQVEIADKFPTGFTTTYSPSEDMEVALPSSVNGKTIYVGFRYVGHASKSGTWDIASFTLTAEEKPADLPVVTSIAALKALESGTSVTLNLSKEAPVYIEYVYPSNAVRTENDQEAYVRDETGALLIKNFLPTDRGWHTAPNGALVGEVAGRYDVVNGMPVFTHIAQSSADNILCLDNRKMAAPQEVALADLVGTTYRADFVQLSNVSLKRSGSDYFATDGTTSLPINNAFALSSVTLPDAVTGYRFTLQGILQTNESGSSRLALTSIQRDNTVVDLFDTESNSTLLTTYDGVNVDAYVKRELAKDAWTTLCLPFNISDAGDALGNIRLAEFTGYDAANNILEFTSTNDIVAGRPYLILPQEDLGNQIHVGSVTLSNQLSNVTHGVYSFVPSFDPVDLDGTDTSLLLLTTSAALSHPTGTVTLKAFQAYFKSAGTTADATISIDGTPTGIVMTTPDSLPTTGKDGIYTLDGRKVTHRQLDNSSTGNLPKGVYVEKGAKRIVK